MNKTRSSFKREAMIIIIVILLFAVTLCFWIAHSKGNSNVTDPSLTSTEPIASESETSNKNDNDADITLAPGDDLTITKAGVYSLAGIYEDQMLVVQAGEEDNVQIILNNAQISNSNGPAIFVRSAGKVSLTADDGSENSISDGSDYTLLEDEKSVDAAVFSTADLTIEGSGNLSITGNNKHAVVSKDNLVVTAKNLSVESVSSGLTGKDSVTLSDAEVTINAGTDGIHSEGTVTVFGDSLTIQCGDDAIRANEKIDIAGGTVTLHAAEGIEATYVLIQSGDITIQASDDGINGAYKSDAYTPTVEITGGNLTVNMGAGDTDGIDSNGNLIITGGTISVNGSSAFDYDGTLTFTGGTVYVNGQQVTEIANQFMGGMGGFGGHGGQGEMGGRCEFGTPPDMPSDIPADFGNQPPSGFHGPHGEQDWQGGFNEGT